MDRKGGKNNVRAGCCTFASGVAEWGDEMIGGIERRMEGDIMSKGAR